MSNGNALATWDPNSGAALPAYLTDAAAAFGGSNIPDRVTVPSLSYEGKVWQIVKDGNRTKMTRKNEDGDEEPVQIMRVVLLNNNPDRGRAYYPGVYDPAKASAPKCWSADGKTPDASVKEKESGACQGCPQSIKGSKVQDGKDMVACSSHRMIALVPAFAIEHEPLRLKIAVTSDYDKEIVEHGWFAYRQYLDFLKSRGIVHTGMVVTKIKFDPNVAYPKLLFSLDRPLDPQELQKAVAASQNPKVGELLAEKWTAAGVNGTLKDESDMAPDDGTAALARAVADGWIAHPTPGYHYKGQTVLDNVELAAQYPAPAPEPAPAPPPIPAAQQVIEGTATVAHDPISAATADGWAVHPQNPEYYFKGQEVVATADLAAKYPAPAAAAPAAPPAAPAVPEAPAAPAPVAAPPHNPVAAAEADGWIKHPTSDGYHYKGQEVVATADLAGKYPAPAAGAAAPSAPTSPPAASPSSAPAADGGVPGDVQALLNQWTAAS